MFRVMIVDDQREYRGLVRAMLERESDFLVVAEAGDGNEAVELMDDADPDLVIMDVQMPLMDGFEATRLIVQHRPDTRVVLISRTRRQGEYSHVAQEVGATAFVTKADLNLNVIRQALQS